MAREFARSGIRVRYPAKWTVADEETDEGWSVSFTSPDTAFLMLSHYPVTFAPAELTDMALSSMRETYPDLEMEEIIETLGGVPAVGYDVDFFMFDLVNTCWIRAVSAPEGSLLLMGQCTDSELEENGEAMRAIYQSLTFEDEA